MIGTFNQEHREAVIVGAGIAGLLVTYHLVRQGYRVKVFESRQKPGGLIDTRVTPFGISESAAHSLMVTADLKKFLHELELPVESLNPEAKKKFILRRGEWFTMPLGFAEIFSAFSRSLLNREQRDENNLYKWSLRHFGKSMADYLIDPMTIGTFGAAPQEIDIRAAYPAWIPAKGNSFLLHRFFSKKGRSIKPHGQIMAPQWGMHSLIDVLYQAICRYPASSFHFNSSIEDLGQLSEAKNLVLCTPAYVTSRLISRQNVELARALADVKYTPLVSVTVFVRKEDLPRSPRGLGILIPSKEKRRCLGVLFNSAAFPGRVRDEDVHHSFTLLLGGSRTPELAEASDEKIRRIVKEEMDSILSLKATAAHMEIYRWKQAIPLYDKHLRKVWGLARQSWCKEKGRILFGNYTGQVSIRGMFETCDQNFLSR